MFVRQFGWSRLVLGLALALGLLALGTSAVAQQYLGDESCKTCHPSNYDSYIKHGHATKVVHTGGTGPTAGNPAGVVMDLGRNEPLAYPWGQVAAIPAGAAAAGVTWEDVEFIMRGSSGAGSFRLFGGHTLAPDGVTYYDGKQISDTTGVPGMAYSCGKCHNTGYTDYPPVGGLPDPDLNHHQWQLINVRGIWKLDGIQCEACHGSGMQMTIPDAAVCAKCHTGDKWDLNDVNQVKQIPYHPTTHGFTTHHPQGDEFLRSPHVNRPEGCALCHDPHKSVFHEDGGVLYATEFGVGNMCKHCHKKHVRGSMAEFELECVDCHMAPVGGGTAGTANSAHGPTHLFKINNTDLAADANTVDGFDAANGNAIKWWKTDENGQSFLTLDLACDHCHENMTLAQMAAAAKGIHRQPGLVDLTVNERDSLQVVSKTAQVSVDFSVEGGDKTGMKSDWWVICQGPKGWSSWNGKKWVRGFKPWRRGAPLTDTYEQNVLKSKLPAGYYTYWVCLYPADGSENFDSVPLYVKKR